MENNNGCSQENKREEKKEKLFNFLVDEMGKYCEKDGGICTHMAAEVLEDMLCTHIECMNESEEKANNELKDDEEKFSPWFDQYNFTNAVMRLAMLCSVSISDLVGAIEMVKMECLDAWKEGKDDSDEEDSNETIVNENNEMLSSQEKTQEILKKMGIKKINLN